MRTSTDPTPKAFAMVKPSLVSVFKGEGVREIRSFKALESEPFDTISMGTRPSGTLHLGNLFVLAAALHYLRINNKARINLDIMDLDFDTQRGAVFTPFVRLPSTQGFKHQLELAVVMISSALNVNPSAVQITRFSERLKAGSSVRQTLEALFADKEATKAIKFSLLGEPGDYESLPISLICDVCDQSASTFSTIDRKTDTLQATCANYNCSVSDYLAGLSDVAHFNVHYLLDPIRDLFMEGKRLHIFGGDYSKRSSQFKVPKYRHTAAAMLATKVFLDLEAELPSFFLTPMLVDQYGIKISKSLGNGGNAENGLIAHLQEQVARVLHILNDFVNGTLDGCEIRFHH